MAIRIGICAALMLMAACLSAQAQAPQAPAATPALTDPLGRDSPRGTITGFASAARREDFPAAAAYLQLAPRQRGNAEALSRAVRGLLDAYYTQPLNSLSSSPGGIPDDGLSLDRERLALAIPKREAELLLVRIADPQAGQIWLISSASLDAAWSMRGLLEQTIPAERWMPRWMIEKTWFGTPIGRWVAWFATLVIPFLIFRAFAAAIISLARRHARTAEGRHVISTWHHGIARPIVVALTLGVHMAALPMIGFTLAFRLAYTRWAVLVAVVALAWLLWRGAALAFVHARLTAERRGLAGRRSLMLLGERVAKVVIVLATIFLLLTVLGVDMTTALAGVGIGGVALALGAQKSIENLLGGVFLLSDRVIAVGDFCCIAGRSGWVEDITLRSVRLRTTDQSLLSIPAGVLSQETIENFATRARMPLQCTLPLQYGSSTAQLRTVLGEILEVLERDPTLDAASVRVRLIEFSPSAIHVELFAYVRTADFAVFAATRERLLLASAEIIESAGCAFARPPEPWPRAAASR